MAEQKKSRIGTFLIVLAALAIMGLAWLFLKPTVMVSDPTPLPQGVVSPPDIATLASDSEARIELRLPIDALASLISKKPFSIDDGIGKGTITVTKLQLSPRDGSRIRMDKADAVFKGRYPVKGLVLNGAKIDLAKSTLLPRIDDEWVLRGNPDLDVDVDDIDEPSLIPDELLEFAANTFFNGTIARLLENRVDIPLKRLVETPWKQLHAALSRSVGNTKGVLFLRPHAAFVTQPIVESATKSIRMGVGLDFASVLALGDTAFASSEGAGPLPPLKELPPESRTKSHLRLPIVARVADLEQLWKPLPVPGLGGDFRINAVNMTEKDGLLHGRMQFALQRERGSSVFLPRIITGFIRFQARPTCDTQRGCLGIADFSLTEKSNSILVDLVGSSANGLIRTAVEKAVTELSAARFRQAEIAARTHVNEYLADAVSRWADSVPAYSDELKRLKPEVTDIVFNPIDVIVKNGYLTVTLQADATISIALSAPLAAAHP